MRTASPLRYPGGKESMTSLLRETRRLNDIEGLDLAEPFAGGAGASLSLLFNGDAPRIRINDADEAIHDFGWSILHRTAEFGRMIDKVPLSIEEWKRQRAIYREPGRASRLRRGFAAFYLNRTNRSGILLKGGPIGGLEQAGAWKLDARFNRDGLKQRIQRVADHRRRVSLSSMDGLALLDECDHEQTFWFIDPPYFHKGETLYLNSLDVSYHQRLADRLKLMPDAAWVVTYDDCPEIRAMYHGWATVREFGLRYVANERRSGREVMITPHWMKLPEAQTSGTITW